MTYSDPQSAALLAHIVSQVENNVDFLASQGYLTQADASAFLAKLPRSTAQNNTAVPAFPTPAPRVTAPSPAPAPSPSPASAPSPPAVPQARAIWDWNGQDSGDLSLAQGDVIEIIEETNNDWWTGRVNGRQGIFPASYVEKIQAPAATSGRPVYKPFRAAYHGMDQPPAPAPAPAPAPTPPGQTNSVGLQEAPGQEEKKSKYGKLGNTMAHSAAGGVGFGAGAAIGGGLVRAIF